MTENSNLAKQSGLCLHVKWLLNSMSERSVRKWWSQSRADYLAENSISRNKPWNTSAYLV